MTFLIGKIYNPNNDKYSITNQTVAIVDGSEVQLLDRLIGADLVDAGIPVDYFEHAIPAIEAFRRKQFGFILTNLEIAPGDDVDNHPELRAAFYSNPHSETRNYNYSEVGLFIVKAARQSPLNAKTSILVANVSSPVEDGLYPLAEKRSLEAGANGYICTMEKNCREEMLSRLEKVLGNLPVWR